MDSANEFSPKQKPFLMVEVLEISTSEGLDRKLYLEYPAEKADVETLR